MKEKAIPRSSRRESEIRAMFTPAAPSAVPRFPTTPGLILVLAEDHVPLGDPLHAEVADPDDPRVALPVDGPCDHAPSPPCPRSVIVTRLA